MKRLPLMIVLSCSMHLCFGQWDSLDNYDARIMRGDKSALYALAPLLDSPGGVLPRGADELDDLRTAMWVLKGDCAFLPNELIIDPSLTTDKFLRFLDSAGDRLVFDDTTGKFLVTPLWARHTRYDLMENELITEYPIVLNPAHPDEKRIETLLEERNPAALLEIAAAIYRNGSTRGSRDYDLRGLMRLLENLTQLDVSVPDEKDILVYNHNYDETAAINTLIYWEHHYKDYQWDGGLFVNAKEKPRPPDQDANLFVDLSSPNDSIAMAAFVGLSSYDTVKTDELLDQYAWVSGLKENRSLPQVLFKFIRVTNRLIFYCRQHGIAYEPGAALAVRLNRLTDEKLPFADRYACEDSLIDELSVRDITQVEYFGLLHEESWEATYSIGRILDKFYSRHWQAITGDQQQLSLYLKKDTIFRDLGIIGICNKYGKKFENPSGQVLYNDKKVDESNADLYIDGSLKAAIYRAYEKEKNGGDDSDYALSKCVSRIRFSQIGELMKIRDADTELNGEMYNFLETDFGFPVENDDTVAWRNFEIDFFRLDERRLYEKYLGKVNPVYLAAIERGDYARIYDFLKYDVVDAFVGGGSGRRDDGVYMLIKLLELHFHTTLGFPHKLCNGAGVYGCDSGDRAKYWMRFLVVKGLARPVPGEPVSISRN